MSTKKQLVKKMLMAFVAITILNASQAQGFLKKLQNKIIPGKTDTASTSSSLSNSDIVSGLKEALNTGTTKSATRLSAADGFLKDAAVKILLPPQVQKIEKTARMIGAGKVFDEAVTSMNRAAENAAQSAAPIFLAAIKNMSISDALGILKGGDTSATSYLRRSSTAQLTAAFRPSVDSSITKVGATKYWNSMATTYNKFSTTPMDTDLTAYVTQKAIDGIFYYVAQEEKNIRKDPTAYASSIIQKVFGGK